MRRLARRWKVGSQRSRGMNQRRAGHAPALVRCLSERELDHEPAAAARLRLASDVSTMADRNLPHQREAETPTALYLAAPGRAIERLEDPLAIFRGDALAVVGNDDTGEILVPRHGDMDGRPPMLGGIFEKIADEAPEQRGVAPDLQSRPCEGRVGRTASSATSPSRSTVSFSTRVEPA